MVGTRTRELLIRGVGGDGNKMFGREHESFLLEGGGMEIKCWDENMRASRLRGMFVMGIKFWDENTRASLWGGWGI